MKTTAGKYLFTLAVAWVTASCLSGCSVPDMGAVGTGYTAKIMCSSVFVSGRDPEDVWEVDLAMPRGYFVGYEVDFEDKSVEASVFGLFRRKAVYRDGLGCTIAAGISEAELRGQPVPELSPLPLSPENISWPMGDALPSGPLPPEVDKQKLEAALDWAFSEPDPEHLRRTRAVVVVYKGGIIAERYAPGFSKDTPLLGWSMTKSVNSALVGILAGQGRLSVDKPAPVPEWQEAGDPRAEITLDNLLRMSSGLDFLEEYESNIDSDCNKMLFTVPDSAAFAAQKPLAFEPGTRWYYSSGDTNIIARIVRQAAGETLKEQLAFPRIALFNRIGMRGAVMEPDPSGTFVASSFMYATARDWARFGLLYLNDGVWLGERILPEGWVEYTTTPTPHATQGRGYGTQFWLNTGGENRWMPELPQDLYACRGHEGQTVTIIPSRGMVVVRLGFTVDSGRNWDAREFLLKILEAIKD